MPFVHATEFKPLVLDTKQTEEGRFYVTPKGDYPSITTLLGRLDDGKWLIEWQARIGKEEADRISSRSALRGTSLHGVIESYINNTRMYERGHMPEPVAMFRSLKPILDQMITRVLLQEASLYSDRYKMGGRVDMICEIGDSVCVVDFKSSGKVKKREWIESYFLQAAAYSFMFEELYDKKVAKNAILIAVEQSRPQVFVSDPEEYRNHSFFLERITA